MNRKVVKSGNVLSLERAYDIIKAPLITEKATMMTQFRQFAFDVACDANKIEIKQAIEKLFKVTVVSVNTLNRSGKMKRFKGFMGRRNDVKRAMVTLKEGDSIDMGSGI